MADIYALRSGYPVHNLLLDYITILHNYTSLASSDLAIVPSHNSIKHTVIQVLFPGVPVYIQALRFTPLRQDKAAIHTPYSVLVLRTPYSDRVLKVSEEKEQRHPQRSLRKKKKKSPLGSSVPTRKQQYNIQANSKAGCHRKRKIMETWKVLQPRNYDRADAVPVQAQTVQNTTSRPLSRWWKLITALRFFKFSILFLPPAKKNWTARNTALK